MPKSLVNAYQKTLEVIKYLLAVLMAEKGTIELHKKARPTKSHQHFQKQQYLGQAKR